MRRKNRFSFLKLISKGTAGMSEEITNVDENTTVTTTCVTISVTFVHGLLLPILHVFLLIFKL